jgi:hypothetical protein
MKELRFGNSTTVFNIVLFFSFFWLHLYLFDEYISRSWYVIWILKNYYFRA